jgi:hypothetical protein
LGQIEVYEWLKKQNNGKYYTPKEVFKGMVKDGFISENSNKFRNGNISGALALLEAQGYLKVRVSGKSFWDFQRRYAIDKKTLNME